MTGSTDGTCHRQKSIARDLCGALLLGRCPFVALSVHQRAANPSKGRRFGDPGRSVGEHPQRGGAILVKKGRYGPYVTNSGINATIPDNIVPDEITLDQAVGLIEARAEKTGAKPAPRRKGPRKDARVAKPAEGKTKATKPKKKAAKPGKTITAAE